MDANDCRKNAKRCIEMADNAQVAEAWNELAGEMETDASLRAAVNDIEISESQAPCTEIKIQTETLLFCYDSASWNPQRGDARC